MSLHPRVDDIPVPRAQYLKNNYRTLFMAGTLILVFYFSTRQSYLLFHTIVELISIVVAFSVFLVTWNSRKMLDNNCLYFVGLAYLFIGTLDLMHTLTFTGMNIIPDPAYFANQIWVATRFMEAVTFVLGFYFLNRPKRPNADTIIVIYFCVTLLIGLSIMVWRIFPVCFIEGIGQTPFKVYAEYTIIAVLLLAIFLLLKHRESFSLYVYRLLLGSLIFTVLSEFCFTLYVSNYSTANELGHYAKLISFILIYKSNVETGFTKPTASIFKNLKDNEKKYKTLAENLPGLILRYDVGFKRIYANSRAIQFSQAHDAQSPALPAPLQDTLKLAFEKARETGQVQETSTSFDHEGIKHFYAVQVIPEQGLDGQKATYLAICQDITRLKLTEQQLQGLNATKDKLFSIIAHDLKNPFTSILSYSDLIYKNAEKLAPQKIAHMALRMNESSKQAYVLLENLLSWSRLQTGALRPSFQPIDVQDLVTDTMNLSRLIAESKHISITTVGLEGKVIFADRQMVAAIFRNLLSNAIKFSYPESTIVIEAKHQLNDVLFSVTDTGTGIQEEHLVRLLKKDSNFSTSGTGAEQGTGLGLVLCKEFAEINGGRIWIESEYGSGTTFYFTLPTHTNAV
jgi:signal transduction histidine kinase